MVSILTDGKIPLKCLCSTQCPHIWAFCLPKTLLNIWSGTLVQFSRHSGHSLVLSRVLNIIKDSRQFGRGSSYFNTFKIVLWTRMGCLPRWFVAERKLILWESALSGSNMCCGVLSMVFAGWHLWSCNSQVWPMQLQLGDIEFPAHTFVIV